MSEKKDAEGCSAEKSVKKRKIRASELIPYALAAVGIYLFAAICSYFFNWKSDQSFLGAYSPYKQADNITGQFGNAVADLLAGKGFGIFALLVPCMILWLSAWFFKKRRIPIAKPMVGMSAGMILLSLLFGVYSSKAALYGGSLCGAHGYIIGGQLFRGAIGAAGVSIVLFICCAALLYYLLPDNTVCKLQTILKNFFSDEENSDTPSDNEENDAETFEPLSNIKKKESKKSGGIKDIPFEIEKPDGDEYNIPQAAVANSEEKQNISEMPFATVGATEMVVERAVDDSETASIDIEDDGRGDVAQADEVEPSSLPYDPKKDLEYYEYPPAELLNEYQRGVNSVSDDELTGNKNRIVETLGHYGIQIKHIKATVGPTITLYEIVPADGVRIAKIKSLENDIALSLAALGIRIIAPMPGKGTIGIEVPNQNPEIVPMQAIIKSQEFQDAKYELPIALGKTITNKAFVVDLAKMPHLLIAGATGQGKSVGLNAVLVSLLYKMHPAQLKMVLVDPKKVELPLYASIEKHFLAKLPDAEEAIITDNQKVIYTINSLCIEMDSRYLLLKDAGVRNVKEYNQKFVDRRLNPKKGHRYLPYIVLVIDEFADLIMTAGKEVETPIARLAQLARAIGIHLIIATQRPTVNIITGLIKANFPARIAFRVTSLQDSRTILDQSGAQQLIGKGDMLVSTGSELVRVQCAFVDTPEVERITEYIGRQQGYAFVHELPEYTPPAADDSERCSKDNTNYNAMNDDDLIKIVARKLFEANNYSTSFIQRKFNIGYNRAGRLMDRMEELGIVGSQQGSKPRQAIITDVIALENALDRI